MKNRFLAALVASVVVGVMGLPGVSFLYPAQAATSTTHYALTKPAVNDPVDQDLWGTELNLDLDTIDTTMFGLSTPAESVLTFTDITTNNASTSKHGFCPKLPNDATKYLDGSGAWSVPVGSGGGGGGSPVTSVAGRTGAVVLSASDISGLTSPVVTSGTNGKIVMGSVTIEWGQGSGTISYPQAFSSSPYSVTATSTDTPSSSNVGVYVTGITNAHFSVSSWNILGGSAGSPTVNWIAIGPT